MDRTDPQAGRSCLKGHTRYRGIDDKEAENITIELKPIAIADENTKQIAEIENKESWWQKDLVFNFPDFETRQCQIDLRDYYKWKFLFL